MPYKHIPVMLSEVVNFLNCSPGKTYVDCTLGGSGHALAILGKIIPGGLLIGIDQDKDAILNAKKVLRPYESNVRLFHENFINLPEILSQTNINAVDGIVLDLGLSFYQLELSGRGFSFKKDEPLDMRMNVNSQVKAEDLVNRMDEKGLKKLFKQYGEERWAKQIAHNIVNVKHRIKALEGKCICPPDFPKCVCNPKKVVRSLTRKVLRPTEEEIAANPMARSAKLRACEKI